MSNGLKTILTFTIFISINLPIIFLNKRKADPIIRSAQANISFILPHLPVQNELTSPFLLELSR
jgi:hypothetical protein